MRPLVLALVVAALAVLPSAHARADGWVLGASADVLDEPARSAPVGTGVTALFEAYFGTLASSIGVRASASLDALRGEPRGDVALLLSVFPWFGLHLGGGVRGGRYWPDDHRQGGAGPELMLGLDATIPFEDIGVAFWAEGATRYDAAALRLSVDTGLVYAVDRDATFGFIQFSVGIAWLHASA